LQLWKTRKLITRKQLPLSVTRGNPAQFRRTLLAAVALRRASIRTRRLSELVVPRLAKVPPLPVARLPSLRTDLSLSEARPLLLARVPLAKAQLVRRELREVKLQNPSHPAKKRVSKI
jgi:hypothetical protein